MGAGRHRWQSWIPEPSGEPFILCTRFPERPGLWDLSARPDVVGHWVSILRENCDYLLRIVAEQGTDEQVGAARRVAAILRTLFDDLESGAATRRVRTVHAITAIREHLLRAHGIADPYREIKAEQAARVMEGARGRCRRLWEAGTRAADGSPTQDERRRHVASILAGFLAGNLFDLGSRSTQAAFRRGELDRVNEDQFLGDVEPFVDAMPATARALLVGESGNGAQPTREESAVEAPLVIFADNAGPDFLLGVVPAALYWSRRRPVRIVVNSEPASSDITYPEARELLAALASETDAPVARALESGRLRLVPSGTGAPGIDLRHVAPALNEAARGAAWVLIDGQGRGVETNWTTRFACPVLRICVIKDPLVAAEIGAHEGRPLLRWDEASER